MPCLSLNYATRSPKDRTNNYSCLFILSEVCVEKVVVLDNKSLLTSVNKTLHMVGGWRWVGEGSTQTDKCLSLFIVAECRVRACFDSFVIV